MAENLHSLNQVRQSIDRIDLELIRLLAQRQTLVEEAGRLKPKGNVDAVLAKDRVAAVLQSRRRLAKENGLSPEVAESIWRAMIKAFTDLEIAINRQ